MKDRCYNSNNNRYERYGGRGIVVCKEWLSFESFAQWAIANGYKDGLTIDRIDNDGNYEPSNCKWSTQKEQSNNRSTNVPVTINGVTKNLKQWADEAGIKENTIRTRYYQYGWTGAKLIEPIAKKSRQLITINGVSKSMSQWAKDTGISRTTLIGRYKSGKRGNDLIKEVKPVQETEVVVESIIEPASGE